MRAKRSSLMLALQIAAHQYKLDATIYKPSDGSYPGGENTRLANQFDNQAVEALKLVDKIEQADLITLED